jgi:hypothetical protein
MMSKDNIEDRNVSSSDVTIQIVERGDNTLTLDDEKNNDSDSSYEVAIIDIPKVLDQLDHSSRTSTTNSSIPNLHSASLHHHHHLNINETFDETIWDKVICTIKTIFSGIIFAFSIFILISAIFQKQTKATSFYELDPILAFFVTLFVLTWLALMEGGLNSMIGLVPVEPTMYQRSHPRTYQCTKIAHKPGNVERFIVGRQYLDLMCVFTTNLMVSAVKGATIDGLPQTVTKIFFKSGIAVIIVTIVYGQLSTQINSSKFMLDSMNSYAMIATTYLAFMVESSGIVHATYFVSMIVERIGGVKPKQRSIMFWIQVFLSVCLLCVSLGILFTALFQGKTTAWDGVPPYASMIIFVVVVLVVGMMDGLQIALMAVLRMPVEAIDSYPVAKRNCDVVFRGKNLEAFLVGRQMFQTLIQFSIARMISFDPTAENMFGVSDSIQKVFNSGILGALITTIIASLAWRVVANAFPLAFLSNPASRPIIWLCFFAEGTGLGNIAWVIAEGYEKLFGLKSDDHYLGSSSYYATKMAKSTNDELAADTVNGSDRSPSLNDEQV